jgi:hypothetical protein
MTGRLSAATGECLSQPSLSLLPGLDVPRVGDMA